jgi:hypothetical protein
MKILLSAAFVFIFWCLPTGVAGQGAPYPASPVIRGVTFDWSSHDRCAPGSDNWPVTWADDGNQYTTWGDGGGFGGDDSLGRVSLGIARIQGWWDDYRGVNVWGGYQAENKALFDGKSYGILFVDGALYMWRSPGSDNVSYQFARLYRSGDYGASWTPADWQFVFTDGIIMPTILNFDKNYAGARDDYVYHYFIKLQDPGRLAVHKPGVVFLLRVPRNALMKREAYEFFAGTPEQPAWSRRIEDKRAVFKDPRGVGWCLSVSYNAALGRYLLSTEHDATVQGNIGIFDAPEPWGPWTTVLYASGFGYPGEPPTTFFWNFSNKWLGRDGRTFTLIFTGVGVNDSWNLVRGRFTVAPRKDK